jgi:hypothetical protein
MYGVKVMIFLYSNKIALELSLNISLIHFFINIQIVINSTSVLVGSLLGIRKRELLDAQYLDEPQLILYCTLSERGLPI